MLNVHELQVFLAAAETENFSEAGRRLNISQPAVSMQIRALETRMGMELFRRSGRHIALTEAVRALLRLVCFPTAVEYVLTRLLAGLRELYPGVEVVCHVTVRDNALQMLREGEVHIALSSLREPYKDIEYRPFLTDHIVLIVPPDHPWAHTRHPIQPEDLETQNFILREESSGTLQAIKEALAWHEMSLEHLNTVMVLGNSEAIRMAVQEGIGVSFVSIMVAAEAARNGTLHIVEVDGLNINTTLYMARHTGRPATRAQSAFWDFAFAPQNEYIRQRPSLFVVHDEPEHDQEGAALTA